MSVNVEILNKKWDYVNFGDVSVGQFFIDLDGGLCIKTFGGYDRLNYVYLSDNPYTDRFEKDTLVARICDSIEIKEMEP